MDRLAEVRDAFGEVPINRHLGFILQERSAERTVVSLDLQREFVQETGVVHGGVIATLADTAAVYLFMPDLDPDEHMTSVEFKLNFLRAVDPERGPLVAVSSPIRRGSRIGVADVSVSQGERVVAHGLFTYLFTHQK